MSGRWVLSPAALAAAPTLSAAIETYHRTLSTTLFENDPAVNHRLPVLVRSVRRMGTWRVALLLTPWMLARLWFSDRPPSIAVPDDWTAAARENAGYTALGPPVALRELGRQRAHLNYAPSLGHYLLQPLVLAMEQYPDAAAVFAAWEAVGQARRGACGQRKSVSRRQFFARLVGNGCRHT